MRKKQKEKVYYLINRETNQVVEKGDVVTDFLNKKWVLVSWTPPKTPNSSGRVILEDMTERGNGISRATREFYPSIINAVITAK